MKSHAQKIPLRTGLTLKYSCGFLYVDVPPDVQVVPEQIGNPLPQTLRRFRVLRRHPIQYQIVFLVLFKLVHFLLQKIKEQTQLS